MHDGRITKEQKKVPPSLSSLPYATGRKGTSWRGPVAAAGLAILYAILLEILGETGFLIGSFVVGATGDIAPGASDYRASQNDHLRSLPSACKSWPGL
jgi:hypothetical protein